MSFSGRLGNYLAAGWLLNDTSCFLRNHASNAEFCRPFCCRLGWPINAIKNTKLSMRVGEGTNIKSSDLASGYFRVSVSYVAYRLLKYITRLMNSLRKPHLLATVSFLDVQPVVRPPQDILHIPTKRAVGRSDYPSRPRNHHRIQEWH